MSQCTEVLADPNLTPPMKQLKSYAQGVDGLIKEMIAVLFKEQPEDPVATLMTHLAATRGMASPLALQQELTEKTQRCQALDAQLGQATDQVTRLTAEHTAAQDKLCVLDQSLAKMSKEKEKTEREKAAVVRSVSRADADQRSAVAALQAQIAEAGFRQADLEAQLRAVNGGTAVSLVRYVYPALHLHIWP